MYEKQQTKGCKTVERLFRACVPATLAGAAFFTLCLGSDAAVAAGEDLGTWMNSENKGKIQLRECGESGLCGNIVWLKESKDEKGQPWRDMLNPDTSKRGRPVVGIDVLIGAKKIAPDTYQGQIYDPEVGKTYYLKQLIIGRDKVEIKGCLPAGWPCRTKYWTRTTPVKQEATPLVATRQSAPPPGPRVAAAPPPAPRNVAPPPAPGYAPPPPQAPGYAVPPPSPRVEAAPPPAPLPRPVQPRRPDVTAALPPSSSEGGYLVQVAARQDRNEAVQAFNDLQRRHPHILGGLAPEIIRADLGQRGIWFRVGVGPMLQQQAAANFCSQLKSAGADCLIRRW